MVAYDLVDEHLHKSLMQVKVISGIGLILMFFIIKILFHFETEIGYIAFIVGIVNIIWGFYDYSALRK